MNTLERNILDKHFTPVNASANGRYNKDDILKVLNFMKDNPNVQINTIAEYATISLGTLVSWRKKYGGYLGIKTKKYDNSAIKTLINPTGTENSPETKNAENIEAVRISLSMIQELRRLYEGGDKAEMSVNETLFKVDNQYLYVQVQNH